jgi:hypothetical protein
MFVHSYTPSLLWICLAENADMVRPIRMVV